MSLSLMSHVEFKGLGPSSSHEKVIFRPAPNDDGASDTPNERTSKVCTVAAQQMLPVISTCCTVIYHNPAVRIVINAD